MVKAAAINAIPRQDQGHSGIILAPFIAGLADTGVIVDIFFASTLKVKPCSCGHLYYWHKTPGIAIKNQ